MNNPSPIPPAQNATTPVPSAEITATANSRHKNKREIIYAVAGVLAGFVVLPLLIFMVGTVLLGPYAGGKSLGDFYGELFRNLGYGALRTWFIVLAPYLAIWFVRLTFKPWPFVKRGDRPSQSADDALAAQPPQPNSRREPFISP
jgi:hypothetical protein